jgi:hypothetical protein
MLTARCRERTLCGSSSGKLENEVISEVVAIGMKAVKPMEFIAWIRDHRVYSYYLYEAQQMGICSKPPELAALVLDMILREEWAGNG